MGNPFPGVGRNTLRGDSYNNVDASVYKNNQITERINVQLQFQLYNVLNRGYYTIPDPNIDDVGANGTFGNFKGNPGINRHATIGARLIF